MEFATTLRSLLEENNVTQKTVATKIGLAQNTLSSYVNGKRQPDLTILCSLASYFDVSTDYLLGYSKSANDLNNDQKQLLSLTHGMSPEHIQKLIKIAKILSE